MVVMVVMVIMLLMLVLKMAKRKVGSKSGEKKRRREKEKKMRELRRGEVQNGHINFLSIKTKYIPFNYQIQTTRTILGNLKQFGRLFSKYYNLRDLFKNTHD